MLVCHRRSIKNSKSVLQALCSDKLTSELILECHRSLTEVSKEGNKVTVQWIKGHSGSRGNDAADELARKGSETPAYGPEPIMPLPISYIHNQLEQHHRQLHNKYWNEMKTCRQTKEILPELNHKLTKILLKTPRSQLRKIVGLITGHNTLNKHLHIMGKTDSPMCRACMAEEETTKHILLDCKQVEVYRSKYLGNPCTLKEATSNLKTLLGFVEELGWLE
ncbi:uncharacterized protein LOC134751438 [Cydia strobilella]|uniref:uncharacterized protein LOC134751438 n=1 Tax=Cydia strobilella TaxID=1100964 RepID=UPI003004C5D8